MAHIIAGFPAALVPMKIGAAHLMLWHPIKAEEIVLEAAQKELKDGKLIPYWAILWPAAIGLAEHVSQMGNMASKNILGLGAGLSLPSLIAAKAGATVLATDLAFEAMIFADANASANRLKMETKLLDWNEPPIGLQFDLILGADLLYEKDNHKPVLKALQLMLSKGGKVLLSDPNRYNMQEFIQLAEAEGWKTRDIPLRIQWDNGEHPITIWELNR